MSTSILPAFKAAGLPVIQTLHDYKFACPNTTFVSHDRICEACKGGNYYNMTRFRCKRGSLSASLLATAEMYFHNVFRLYEPNIDLFISPSEFLRDKMIEHGMRKPVVVIPNFIYPDSFQPVYQAGKHFVAAGRLVRPKGILTLLEAMRRVDTDAVLTIAGTGELEPQIRHFIRDHALKNVRLTGHLSTPDLVRLIQNAIFTVVPSEWYENYSMTVIESLACGTPVIGSRIGGIPEQVEDGVNGLLFEPGNAAELAEKIQHLVDSPERAIDMGRNGRRRIESVNSPEAHYEQLYPVYDRLLRGLPVSQAATQTRPAIEVV
jgi:glycosyltransferase involved in cell wall biosynthesis